MKMLKKEFRLSASPLSYFFIIAAFLTFVPGYPILLGAFFTTLGIFYSFQTMRENGDINYCLLLPIAKREIVSCKFAFCLLIELASFLIMTVITLIRMSAMSEAKAYVSNALMCANLVFLGFALLIFGLFNLVFIRGFFKTAYYFGKPFIIYCIVSLLVITLAESLHHFPGLEKVNTFGFDNMPFQLCFLLVGVVVFILLTILAEKSSEKIFEKLDF